MMVFNRRTLEPAIVFQFPKEIIEEIFLRLPIKSLGKLRAVCKSWNSLIQTSTFIHNHLSRNQNQNQILLIQATVFLEGTDHDLFSLHLDNPPFDVYSNYKLINNPFVAYNNAHETSPKYKRDVYRELRRVHVVGTCNGLVCLVSQSDHSALIWNPCIRKYVMLTPNISRSEIKSYGFGYDSRTNNYNVLRIVRYKTEAWKISCEIWSLTQPFWRSLDAVPPVDEFRPTWWAASLCGATHWLHCVADKANSIVWFDMSSEVFGEMMIPQVLRKENVIISRYMNSLGLYEYPEFDEGQPLNMWVMKEYGVVESWAKLFTIQLPGKQVILRGFRNNGEAVITCLAKSEYPQILLNPKTNDIGDFQTNGYDSYDCEVAPFVETLVLIDQPHAISC
ncbi:hypothetical protein M0R45_028172 [Rubus argutus]|uniref:F-box domain-containing protein n=1 Tax=Rubus argutus TaxID=59490 RepID=A0AAW1W4C0_RUBAR